VVFDFSLKNLKAKPARTACLVIVAAILAFVLFGGSIITMNLRQGLAVMTKRFGADLMVVPRGSSEKAQSLLLRGQTGLFYFDAGVVGEIQQTDGVVSASPQFFLTSLSSECCDDFVQLIAYDPQTDFVIQPWIAEKKKGQVEDGQVVIGSRITERENKTVKLFNHEYPVAAKLSGSASGFDTSIFMTMNTMKSLINNAHAENYNFLADAYENDVISAVLVKTDPAKSMEILSWDIKNKNKDVDVLVSEGIFSSIANTLGGFVKYIHVFSIALWALAVIILAAVFSGTIHERKKEFAVLRILGATQKKLIGLVLSESSIAAGFGALVGVFLACIVVFPFSVLIGEKLELPFLDTPFFNIVLLVLSSFFLSVIAGPLSSLYSALRISRAETYFTLREGE
jgi:putative ABC transport system permease protein